MENTPQKPQEKEVAEYIRRAKYDSDGTQMWAVKDLPNGNSHLEHLLDIRGWGHIQNIFKRESDAAEFQDAIGKFVEDAINEKIAGHDLTASNQKLLEENKIMSDKIDFWVHSWNHLNKLYEDAKQKADKWDEYAELGLIKHKLPPDGYKYGHSEQD